MIRSIMIREPKITMVLEQVWTRSWDMEVLMVSIS